MGLGRILWRDHGVGLLLAAAHLALLWQSSTGVGVPRDESFYFHAADNAADWFDRLLERPRVCKLSGECGPGMGCVEGHCQPNACTGEVCAEGVDCVEGKCKVRSFSPAELDRGYKYNHEHPVLMKQLFGVSHRLLSEAGLASGGHIRLYRLPTMVMAALALWLTYLLGVLVSGRRAGFFAALSLAWMPRVFFHSQLACFDAPVTFMWLLIVYTFLRATRSRAWSIAAGLALGLGFATKLNIFFVPFTLLGVAALDLWSWRRRHKRWTALEGERGPLTYYKWIALSMLILGPLVFFAHWPWLYHDTWARLKFYVGFHARHVHYPVDYLGVLYFKPPFPMHFPFVFSALTIPVAILVPAFIGGWMLLARAWRQTLSVEALDRQGREVAILANLLVPLMIIALPMTPIFGGTKHWMPAMPFLAVLAGVGLVRIVDGVMAGAELWARLTVSLALLTPALWATLTYGDQGPAYYNSLAGGPSGAAALRMPRNFWGHSTLSVLDDVNELAPNRALVFWHKATGWAIDAYKNDGLLRKDIQYTGDWTAEYSDWAVYHDQKEKEPEELDIWRAYGTDWPVAGEFIDGVQLMAVYQRPGTPRWLNVEASQPAPVKASKPIKPAPDAAVVEPPAPDAAVAEPPAPDAAVVEVPAPDAAVAEPPAPDAAVVEPPEPDAAVVVEPDAAVEAPAPDAAVVVEPDAAAVEPDAAVEAPAPDAAVVVEPDAAAVEPDAAAAVEPDAAVEAPAPDAAVVVEPDAAAAVEPDAAVEAPAPDAAVVIPDATTVKPDATVVKPDVSPPTRVQVKEEIIW
ncbi:glycosyltransferase family 39 protein [Myxococcota bacterium]|nr:glycosyltransferase family 39 protein [Myxococcota bacterium]